MSGHLEQAAELVPTIPAGDTLFSKAEGVFYSYGPRVAVTTQIWGGSSNAEIVPPEEGQEPAFYGVYAWQGEDKRWQWVIDVPSAELAHQYLMGL